MNTNKVALITGANKGLGLEVARQLGRQGITVVIGSRDADRGQVAVNDLRAEGIDAHSVKLEVTEAADVAALPAFFEQNFGRLDILVNNAAVSLEGDDGADVDLLRRTFEANVFAPYAITEALLPLLRRSPAARIVNHSSGLGSLTLISESDDAWGKKPTYTSSKAALNMLTVVRANQLKDTPIKVNAAHPGWVRTDMGTQAADLDVSEGAKTAVELATLPEDGPTGGFFHLGKPLPW